MSREHIWFAIALASGAFVAAVCEGQTREQGRATWVFIAQSVLTSPNVVPTPTPQPPSDICQNCNGRGKIGDGTIMKTCPECDGTGKKKKLTDIVPNDWPPKQSIQVMRTDAVTAKATLEGFDLIDGPGDYRPRWTWPGNLLVHLREYPHSINTSAWTQDQREMYHDQWHDRHGANIGE